MCPSLYSSAYIPPRFAAASAPDPFTDAEKKALEASTNQLTGTVKEAQEKAEAMMSDVEDMDARQVERLIKKLAKPSKKHPKDPNYQVGILYPNKISASGPKLKAVLESIKANMPKDKIPKEGLPIVLKIRGKNSHDEMDKLYDEVIRPYFQFDGKVKGKKGKELEVLETVYWPFLSSLMSGEEPPEQWQELVDGVDNLPLYKLYSPGHPELEKDLNKAFNTKIRRRLLGLELSKFQYFDQLDLKELYASLAIGAIIGGGGETLIHKYFPHDSGAVSGVMRTVLLTVVDIFDNLSGELGSLQSDLKSNGMGFTPTDIFGKDTWGEAAKSGFSIKGDASLLVKRARDAATDGALMGTVLNVPTGFSLSNPKASVEERAIMGGIGTLGTGLGIPNNWRSTVPQAYQAAMQLIKAGKLPLPKGVNTQKEKEAYALKVAKQELLSRVGFSVSLKAFSMVPTSGLILLAEKLGVPRRVVQTTFMSLAAPMENLFRLIFSLDHIYRKVPKQRKVIEELVLKHPDKVLTKKEKEKLEHAFNDKWSMAVGNLLTHPIWPKLIAGVTVAGLYGYSGWMYLRGKKNSKKPSPLPVVSLPQKRVPNVSSPAPLSESEVLKHQLQSNTVKIGYQHPEVFKRFNTFATDSMAMPTTLLHPYSGN